jgi:hypothetical protein
MNPFEGMSTDDTPREISANPGYALGQLARAFATSQTHPDPETRARAEQKVAAWIAVFQGMLSGALQVGSRTPVDAPAWATLEVLAGGFATGALLAGGPLQAHEHELLRTLPAVPTGAERAAIAGYYLGDTGIAALGQMLANGCYRIHVPEEGALLTVAWLLAHDQADQTRAILDAIGPYLSQLRFYPIPAPRPLITTTVVHRQTIAETIRDLQALRVPGGIATEREAVTVWAPLYDRVAALFAETVAGPLPSLRAGPDGTPVRTEAGQFVVDGGWPCQHYPQDWPARARTALDDYRHLRAAHQRCRKPERPSGNFAILRAYLAQCIADPGRLSGRDVGKIRAILAAISTKRGLPGSPRCEELRLAQLAQVSRPTSAELAPVLIERLAQLPQDEGLAQAEEALAPITAAEAARFGLRAGLPLSPALAAKLRRCVDAAVEELVAQKVIPSGEVLARVIPQITAQVRAAGIADPELRRLYGAIYAAFRRRRSLLLLHLQHQVRLEELPWVAAIDAFRTDDLSAREQARQTLEQVVTLAISAFPQQILPNKLLQEIRSLAEGAALRLPIVDEVAADIFMGDFSEKYLRAAQQAGSLLGGTLYERYYGISYAQLQQIDDVSPSRYGTPTSAAFTRLCYERAGTAPGGGRWSVARNGTVIEQEQILTSHNLAVLFGALGLARALEPQLEELARRCFVWICRQQQQRIDGWQPRLRMVKNSAYAWRQMVFFLALLPTERVDMFLEWAYEHLAQQRPAFHARFRPALHGLALTAAGGSLDGQQHGRAGRTRRFLGWTSERHWLLVED